MSTPRQAATGRAGTGGGAPVREPVVAARRTLADHLAVSAAASRRCRIAASASRRPTATSGTSTGSSRPASAGMRRWSSLLHGLEGSSASHYARALMIALMARGWRGVVPHFRGCSGEPNLMPRAYHSGDHAEARAMLNAIRARVDPRLPSSTPSGSRSAAACCSTGWDARGATRRRWSARRPRCRRRSTSWPRASRSARGSIASTRTIS